MSFWTLVGHLTKGVSARLVSAEGWCLGCGWYCVLGTRSQPPGSKCKPDLKLLDRSELGKTPLLTSVLVLSWFKLSPERGAL